MNEEKGDTLRITEDTFGSVEALIADARGNALLIADRVRIGFAAEYLRLAAQKSAALANLLDAVSTVNQRSGDRAKKRIREIDRDIKKFLTVVEKDAMRMLQRRGGKLVMLTDENLEEFLGAVKNGGEIPAHLFDVPGIEFEPDGRVDDSVDTELSEVNGTGR